jgi:SprT-like family
MRWWNLLNNALFDGKLLPPHKIVVRCFRGDHGWCLPMAKKGKVQLGISSEFGDRKEFLTVLAHEMIHQWQWTDDGGGRMTHGETFWQWETTLKRVFNLPLAESY